MRPSTLLALAIIATTASACSTYIPMRPAKITVQNSCTQQCQIMANTCESKCRGNLFARSQVEKCKEACADQRDACLVACPTKAD